MHRSPSLATLTFDSLMEPRKRHCPPQALAEQLEEKRATFDAKDRALRRLEITGNVESSFWYNDLLVFMYAELKYVPGRAKDEKCQEILYRMRSHRIAPDAMTYALCMNMAAQARLPLAVESLLAEMKKGKVLPRKDHFHALIKAWVKSGDLTKARQVLRQMVKDGVNPLPFTFNILIGGSRPSDAAKIVLEEMPEASVKPNVYTFNSWLHVCVKEGDVQAAQLAWSAFKASDLRPSWVTRKTVLPLAALSNPTAQEITREILGAPQPPQAYPRSGDSSSRMVKVSDVAPGTASTNDVDTFRKSGKEGSRSSVVSQPLRSAESDQSRILDACESVPSSQNRQTVVKVQSKQLQLIDLSENLIREPGLDVGGASEGPLRESIDAKSRALRAGVLRRNKLQQDLSSRLTAMREETRTEVFPIAKPLHQEVPFFREGLNRNRANKASTVISDYLADIEARPPALTILGTGFWERFTKGTPAQRGPKWLLDLHGYSEAESQEVVHQKLEALSRREVDRAGALTIVTGKPRYRISTEAGPLHNRLKLLLSHFGVPFQEGPSSNRLLIPSGGIAEYVAAQEKRRLKHRVVKGAAIRYVGAGAVLFATVSLVPLLLDRYAHDWGHGDS